MTNNRREVTRRALRGPSPPAQCRVSGCNRPTQRAAGKGLSNSLCKAHKEFLRRHGSTWHVSIRAADLKPYLNAAREWLRIHHSDPTLVSARSALHAALEAAGEPLSAYDVRPLLPRDKARVALARLRERQVPAERLLGIALGVAARVAHRGPHGTEFLHVQIAKAVHRLASGTHRTRSGLARIPSKYPRPEGRYLRLLGARIWQVAGIMADSTIIQEVVDMARPAAAIAQAKEETRQASVRALTQEIQSLRDSGLGPATLARHIRNLKRQHGVA